MPEDKKTAKKGDKVKVNYTGKFDDGTVFDSSAGRSPLEFTLGRRQVIKGFDDAVDGMEIGQSKTVCIPSADAYGERRDDLVARFRRDQFPPSIKPEVGLNLSMRQPDGGMIDVMITEVSDTVVVVDANHPLAGKDLTFDVQLVAIE
ncbi:MAG: peptidylprolyl isomerase [Nitrospiraceae bacterium]|nr:peptidylprolyl isomerase [Nitrospiraceae bacterium]